MSFLLDTDVVSELRKGSNADRGVVDWFCQQTSDQLWLSCLTTGELHKGIEKLRRRDPRSAAALGDWLSTMLAAYADRILDVDCRIAEEWGRMNSGDPLPVVDSLIAATAKVHGLIVVSGNSGAMKATGVRHINPFSGR